MTANTPTVHAAMQCTAPPPNVIRPASAPNAGGIVLLWTVTESDAASSLAVARSGRMSALVVPTSEGSRGANGGGGGGEEAAAAVTTRAARGAAAPTEVAMRRRRLRRQWRRKEQEMPRRQRRWRWRRAKRAVAHGQARGLQVDAQHARRLMRMAFADASVVEQTKATIEERRCFCASGREVGS